MLALRPITPADNHMVAHVIRTVMPEFNCVGEGYSINDPEVEDMAKAYAGEGSAFFVIEEEVGGPIVRNETFFGTNAGAVQDFGGAVIVGCAGFAPLAGGDGTVCELRKMYILKEARGYGGGKLLMNACLEGARAAGYEKIYLETVSAMTTAAEVYKKNGFELLGWPMGETGHSGCDIYMVRDL
ncbi:GNAT family N-acetyltransferase [Neolewinella aurantiaca]|uniref:GNAT family N-acetyltransferase n=1 Tax=Neolewinella aurantiaca TaxID=2602767 RepID=A0A5C7FRP1_9BACT|nr:GNAT family N-acetyltransferase [Neolewinella aurantiaca]TXF89019.1 GNAT family N-acetyltransferase [Neolewinella aurantiaca]